MQTNLIRKSNRICRGGVARRFIASTFFVASTLTSQSHGDDGQANSQEALKSAYKSLPSNPADVAAAAKAELKQKAASSGETKEVDVLMGNLPLHEQTPTQAAIAVYYASSFTAERSDLLRKLIEGGFTIERAEEVEDLVDEAIALKEIHLEQTSEIEQSDLAESVTDRKELIALNQKRNAEIDSELTDKLFKQLTDDEETKLVAILHRGYGFPDSYLNPFMVRKLSLSDRQLQKFRQVKSNLQAIIYKSNKADIDNGRAYRPLGTRRELDASLDRSVVQGFAVLTPSQFRIVMTATQELGVGERFSQWFARQEPAFQKNLKAYYPDLMAEIANETDSGLLVTP